MNLIDKRKSFRATQRKKENLSAVPQLFQKADLLPIVAVLLAAAVFFGVSKAKKTESAHVQILADNVLLYDIALDTVTAASEYRARSLRIEISPDGARVKSAGCSDRVCMRSGLLCKNGDIAVCLPEKVIVKIVSSSLPDIDAVVY